VASRRSAHPPRLRLSTGRHRAPRIAPRELRPKLYNEARERNIQGRSKMTKDQLARAVGR
jgi:hypothetical protein